MPLFSARIPSMVVLALYLFVFCPFALVLCLWLVDAHVARENHEGGCVLDEKIKKARGRSTQRLGATRCG